jgi:hypothetical protein
VLDQPAKAAIEHRMRRRHAHLAIDAIAVVAALIDHDEVRRKAADRRHEIVRVDHVAGAPAHVDDGEIAAGHHRLQLIVQQRGWAREIAPGRALDARFPEDEDPDLARALLLGQPRSVDGEHGIAPVHLGELTDIDPVAERHRRRRRDEEPSQAFEDRQRQRDAANREQEARREPAEPPDHPLRPAGRRRGIRR